MVGTFAALNGGVLLTAGLMRRRGKLNSRQAIPGLPAGEVTPNAAS